MAREHTIQSRCDPRLTLRSVGVRLTAMKVALPSLAVAMSSLVSTVAIACPFASSTGASDCGACGASLFGYGSWLVLGVGAGLASVAFERRRS